MPGGNRSIKITDSEGHTYDSMLEMVVTLEFEGYVRQGYAENVKKQVPFFFKDKITNFNRRYTCDFTFDCLKSFSVACLRPSKGSLVNSSVSFEAGYSYVVDVKSPLTYKDAGWRFKKALVESVFGIKIVELIRRHPPKPKKPKVVKAKAKKIAIKPKT